MSEQRKEELKNRKEVIKNAPLEDYLTEDSPVKNQNYFVLSYIVPDDDNEIKHPVIKVRGSYKTQDECEKRIEKLKVVDSYFNMYICEVGKFGSLLPTEELSKTDEIDVKYQESLLNTMIQGYKQNKDLADSTFQKRKEDLTQKIKHESSKEGQVSLSSKKENPLSIKTRIEVTEKHIKDLESEIKKCKEILDEDQKKYDTEYTKEEIEEAEKEYKKQYPEKFKIDDFKSQV